MSGRTDPSHDSASREDGLQERWSATNGDSDPYASIGQMSRGEMLKASGEFIRMHHKRPFIVLSLFLTQTRGLDSIEITGKIL
jgi:hypothetical protein